MNKIEELFFPKRNSILLIFFFYSLCAFSATYDEWVQQFSNKLDAEQRKEQEIPPPPPLTTPVQPPGAPATTLSPPQIIGPVKPSLVVPPGAQLNPPTGQPPVLQPGAPGQPAQKVKNLWLPANPWGNTTRNPYPAIPQDNPWNEQVPAPPPEQPLAPTPRPNLPNIFAPNPVQIVPVPVPTQPPVVSPTPVQPVPVGPPRPPVPVVAPPQGTKTEVLNIYK